MDDTWHGKCHLVRYEIVDDVNSPDCERMRLIMINEIFSTPTDPPLQKFVIDLPFRKRLTGVTDVDAENASNSVTQTSKALSEFQDASLLINNILSEGKKEWNRCKIMIVGEGRAGKTALSNSIIGREFYDTESTVGISQLTCDVRFANSKGGFKFVI
jgi:hypothetical protein